MMILTAIGKTTVELSSIRTLQGNSRPLCGDIWGLPRSAMSMGDGKNKVLEPKNKATLPISRVLSITFFSLLWQQDDASIANKHSQVQLYSLRAFEKEADRKTVIKITNYCNSILSFFIHATTPPILSSIHCHSLRDISGQLCNKYTRAVKKSLGLSKIAKRPFRVNAIIMDD